MFRKIAEFLDLVEHVDPDEQNTALGKKVTIDEKDDKTVITIGTGPFKRVVKLHGLQEKPSERHAPKTDINIRKAVLQDYGSIDVLMKQLHNLHVSNRPDIYRDLEIPMDMNEFHNLVDKEDTLFYVADDGGKLAGMCIATVKQSFANTAAISAKIVYIDDIVVDESYRQQGIGKNLFEYIENKAADLGAKRIELMIWSFNDSAESFYKEMGMKQQRCIMEKIL